MKIVIVDGNATVRRIVASMLQQLGHTDIAQLEMLNTLPIADIIIAAGLDEAACAQLQGVPCVYLQDKPGQAVPARAVPLLKPFNAETLRDRMAEVLATQP